MASFLAGMGLTQRYLVLGITVFCFLVVLLIAGSESRLESSSNIHHYRLASVAEASSPQYVAPPMGAASSSSSVASYQVAPPPRQHQHHGRSSLKKKMMRQQGESLSLEINEDAAAVAGGASDGLSSQQAFQSASRATASVSAQCTALSVFQTSIHTIKECIEETKGVVITEDLQDAPLPSLLSIKVEDEDDEEARKDYYQSLQENWLRTRHHHTNPLEYAPLSPEAIEYRKQIRRYNWRMNRWNEEVTASRINQFSMQFAVPGPQTSTLIQLLRDKGATVVLDDEDEEFLFLKRFPETIRHNASSNDTATPNNNDNDNGKGMMMLNLKNVNHGSNNRTGRLPAAATGDDSDDDVADMLDGTSATTNSNQKRKLQQQQRRRKPLFKVLTVNLKRERAWEIEIDQAAVDYKIAVEKEKAYRNLLDELFSATKLDLVSRSSNLSSSSSSSSSAAAAQYTTELLQKLMGEKLKLLDLIFAQQRQQQQVIARQEAYKEKVGRTLVSLSLTVAPPQRPKWNPPSLGSPPSKPPPPLYYSSLLAFVSWCLFSLTSLVLVLMVVAGAFRCVGRVVKSFIPKEKVEKEEDKTTV